MSGSPIANDDTLTALNTGPIIIAILANDTHTEGDSLDPDSITVTSGNAFGTLEIDYINGLLIYTPDPGFIGTEMLAYVVNDIHGNSSNEAIVLLHVVDSLPDPEPEPADKVDLVLVSPDANKLSKMTLRRSGDMLEVINNQTGAVLLSHLLDDVNSLSMLAGGGKNAAMQLTIDFTHGGSFALPAGLSIAGGDSRWVRDSLILRGSDGADQLHVENGAIDFNGLLIDTSSIESLTAQMGLGDDHVTINGKTGFGAVVIHDTGGNDHYTVNLPDNRLSWGRPGKVGSLQLAMAGIFIADRAGDNTYDLSMEQTQNHRPGWHSLLQAIRRPLWSFLSGK